jgi:hypothetical protein
MGIQNATVFVTILLFVCLVVAIIHIVCNHAKSPIDLCFETAPSGIILPNIMSDSAMPTIKNALPNLGISNMFMDLVKNPLSWLVVGSIATIGLSYFISTTKSSTNINVLNYPNNESDCDNNHEHVCLKNDKIRQTKMAIVI